MVTILIQSSIASQLIQFLINFPLEQLFRDELNRIGRHSFIVSALLPNAPHKLKAYFDLKELNG